MPFFPRPGQTEITRTSTESEVTSPLKIAAISALGFDILLLIVHVFTLVVFWWAGWRATGKLFIGLGQWNDWFLDWGLIVTFLPWMFLPWPVAYYWLIHYRYKPELRNRNWPPVYSPLDPAAGLVDAHTGKELIKAQKANVLERMYRARSGKPPAGGQGEHR